MKRNNWIISLLLVLASILFATTSLARPIYDGAEMMPSSTPFIGC